MLQNFGWGGPVEGRLTTFGGPFILGGSLLSGYIYFRDISHNGEGTLYT